MSDHHKSNANQAVWDGRFGKRFDDEVSTPGVAWTIIGTGLITVIAMILMYGFIHWIVGGTNQGHEPMTMAVGAQPTPPLPRLQAKPEAEYRAFEAQMTARLETYGWVDQSAGVVHIPIDEAMTLLVEQGLPQTAGPTIPGTTTPGATTPASASDAATDPAAATDDATADEEAGTP